MSTHQEICQMLGIHCWTCGVWFAFPEALWDSRKNWIRENGEDDADDRKPCPRDGLWCPNGHFNMPIVERETTAEQSADALRAHYEEQLEAARARIAELTLMVTTAKAKGIRLKLNRLLYCGEVV